MRFSNAGWITNCSLALACVFVVMALMLAPIASHAASYNLVSGNSSVFIDPATTIGVSGWAVDGINQLGGQWWFYRIGETNQAPINALAVPVVTQLSANVLDTRYVGESVDLILRYTLTGGPAGSGNSTIAESMRIRNKTAAPIQFHLFEYTDLNLNDTPDDDIAALLNPTTVGQWDGAIITTETASTGGMTPVPNRWEVASATDLFGRLNTAPIYNLANATTPFEGNAAFAFQWDMNIPAGGTQILSKSKILMRGGAIGDTVWFDSNGDGVQDTAELGITGVALTLTADFNRDGTIDYTDSMVTDENGYYLFPNLPGGLYKVAIDPNTLPAGALQTYDLDGLGTPHMAAITLNTGEVNLDVDFGYWQLASVGDRVWNDLNADGIQDAGELGINGATVTIKDSDGNAVGTATTSGDGNYSFIDLLPGTYTVSVDASTLPAGFAQTFDLDGVLDNATTVALAAGDDRKDVDFGYRQLGSIGDRVWNDLNSNGIQETGEPGINGVTVTIEDTDGTIIGTATTSDDGNYLFTDLPTGTYTVSVDASTLPAGMVQTYDLDGGLDNTAAATLAAGQNITDVDFGYWKPASVGDRVWNDLNANGVQDAGEPGINGVKVVLKDSSGNLIATAMTDGDGNYLFAGLPGGSYAVSVDGATVPAGLSQTFDLDTVLDNNTNAALAAGDNRTDVDFGYTGGIPSICLVKTGPATAKVGDTITYHFKVTNTGNTYLNNVVVNDPLLGGVIWQQASMAPGEVVLFDRTFLITSSSLTTASVSVGGGVGIQCVTPPPPCPPKNKLVNKATVTGTTPTGGTVSDESSCTTLIEQAAGSLGDRVWLDYNANGVQNAGEPGINGVKVTLKDSNGNTIATTTTAGDGKYTFTNLSARTYKVVVSSSTLPANVVETYELDGTRNNSTTVTLAAGQNRTDVDFGYTGNKPGVCLVKTGPATAKVGDTITYHFKVTNTGNTYLYGGVTVSDPLLGGDIWHKTPVAPGEVNEFDRTYVVRATAPGGCGAQCVKPTPTPGYVLVNRATATGCPPIGCKVTCTSSCSTTIVGRQDFRTFTQGGWGSKPNGGNPGALLKANFCKVYPIGYVSIGGAYRLKFTGAWAIQNFLPQGGKAAVLKCSATNPSSSTAGVFAGQVLALKLNVDFSNAGVTCPGLGNVRLTSGPLSGRTIAQVLDLAQRVLGGETWALPWGMTISQLNDVVDGINNRYDG